MDSRAGRSMCRMMRSPHRSGRASSMAPGALPRTPLLNSCLSMIGRSSLSGKFHQPGAYVKVAQSLTSCDSCNSPTSTGLDGLTSAQTYSLFCGT